MSDVVIVACITGGVNALTAGLAYLGMRNKVEKTHREVGEKLDATIETNETQIKASNNFNQKIDKLHQGQIALNQGQAALNRKVDRIEKDLHTLSEGTGINIGC